MGSRKGIPNKTKTKAVKAVELMKSGKVKDKRLAMELAGYSVSSIAAHTIGRTKEYKEYLETIDDTAITEMWKKDALDPDYKDKRLQYDKQKELVALKDRNPLNVIDKTGSMPILNMVFENAVIKSPDAIDVTPDVK